MSEHLQDEERVEALKRWWAENGRSTVIAVVLAIGGTVGWQQYQGFSADRAEAASEQFSELLLAAERAETASTAREIGADIKREFPSSAYARFAALQLAALAVDSGDLSAAEAELRWALQAGDTGSELGQLIQLRLARVLAAAGDAEGALAILEPGSSVFPVAYNIAIGDIHLSRGDESAALAAYQAAQRSALPLGAPPGLLDAKITSLQSRLERAAS